MVTDKKKDSHKTPGKQGSEDSVSEPNKINASTPYDFNGKKLTPYGGLLPVITMLHPARQRRLLASLAEVGQQTPIVVVAAEGQAERLEQSDGQRPTACFTKRH